MSSKRSTRRRAGVHVEAQRELAEAREYYDRQAPGYGLRFVEAVEREFELLREFPRIGKAHIRGTRRRTMTPDWPFSIVYQPFLDGIYIIAVAHHKRRPYYWTRRLRGR